jgi:hypothetical protein
LVTRNHAGCRQLDVFLTHNNDVVREVRAPTLCDGQERREDGAPHGKGKRRRRHRRHLGRVGTFFHSRLLPSLVISHRHTLTHYFFYGPGGRGEEKGCPLLTTTGHIHEPREAPLYDSPTSPEKPHLMPAGIFHVTNRVTPGSECNNLTSWPASNSWTLRTTRWW